MNGIRERPSCAGEGAGCKQKEERMMKEKNSAAGMVPAGAGTAARKAKSEWGKIIWPDRNQVRAVSVAAAAATAAVAVLSAVIDSGMMAVFSRLLGI